MLSTKIYTIFESVMDMFAALEERNIVAPEYKMNVLPQLIASIKGVEYPTPISTTNLSGMNNKANAMLQIKQQIKLVLTRSGVTPNDDITDYGDFIREIVAYVITIVGPNTVTGESCTYTATENNHVITPTWSVTSGNQYAVINNNGELTISSGANNNQVTIKASYLGAETTKNITVTYQQGTSTETEVVVDPTTGDIETITTITTENQDGSTTTSTNTVITDESGDPVGSSTSVVTEQQDGSSVGNTTHYDANGNTTQTNQTVVNVDGSSTSATTNYDSNGDPTDTTNQAIDVEGNSSTQNINYDENGDPVVTGYTIDTSGSSSGEKSFNGDGINTEFYAFDATDGFICHMHFAVNVTNKPPSQNENHHNILTMKRANPSPWYGFQLRQSNTNKYIQLGTQFATGSNTNTTINPPRWVTANTVAEYDIEVVYDPLASGNKFICRELISGTTVLTSANTFPDIEDLKYLSVCIGYAQNTDGTPYRYADIDVYEFSLEKISRALSAPVISCNGEEVTITCATENATVYYRLNETGSYSVYSTPISISATTVVEAYSTISGVTSATVKETCIYDPGVATPVITCDGQHVTITCETSGATIYYRLNETGSFSTYTSVININTDTVVEAYATLGVKTSQTTKQTCYYDDGIEEPEILCNGEQVIITCPTVGATIYYRLNETGSFNTYTTYFDIYDDTIVEAYATFNGATSETVTETCIYGNSIESPIISCDGQYVEITCGTPSVDIFYRLNESGDYMLYTEPILISANTIVEAYSKLNNTTSQIVTETCIYVPVVLATPVIICENNEVTISCSTTGSSIYYRLGQTGSFVTYMTPITITKTTVVEAYSTYLNQTSQTVSETCVYVPDHDYSQDYLTLDILTDGTIAFVSNGSNVKTIEYSINNGTWTSWTSAVSGNPVQVVAGDKVRLRGNNTTYATSKSAYSGFGGDTDAASVGTAMFNVEGNIMSLTNGDNFTTATAITATYTFCSMFKRAKVVSAENLILPVMTLNKDYCYRAMFSWATTLEIAPALPATTLGKGSYWYMFESCAITTAPDLNATTLTQEAYGHMFTGCSNLNYIKCLATSISASKALEGWVTSVASSGTFVKDPNMTNWTTGNNGIPTNWVVYSGEALFAPEISFSGDEIELSCDTSNATIYYRLNQTGNYSEYTTSIFITEDTVIETYSQLGQETSSVVTQTCVYVEETPFERSNKILSSWTYNNTAITTPYSVNAIDGHSARYNRGTFNFETSVNLKSAQTTYLWFQHADQSATIYVDNQLVEKHWGGYNAFFLDITNYVHRGTNNIKVALNNNEGNNLAPAAGDFNFNATLGNVKLFTSPVLPLPKYGYDGFHITSTVTSSSATIYVKTTIPSGASVVCTITDGTYTWSDIQNSTGLEQTFTTTISGNNLHLWNGKENPYLYNVKIEIYKDNELYHRYERPYGFRYYDYVYNDTTVLQSGDPYTGFLLNGQPYYLRGVCMHDDIAGKGNALTTADITQEFNIIQELGCNFIRLAHYPHPKEVYDMCDQLGIIVQTEVPCVNKLQSTMPSAYYTNLTEQYKDMVNQHYNHPCIMFWGLSNETTTDDKEFGKTKIEEYTALIKSIDTERKVGYVISHSYNNPSAYYNNPNVDWFGCNIYVGWYINNGTNGALTNDPTNQLTTRVNNTIVDRHKPLAFSEYGCGGTQHCHSDDPQTTTTKGNYERHDIEYQMWLHEGHIAAIRNFPQLLFTAQWQLFDIAVANRNEGYTVCLDGENTSTDDSLRRLNNKGLVERDHVTKKDTFYLYKAEWNSTQRFVHICGKDYTKITARDLKCYTNDGDTLTLYVNDVSQGTAQVTNHIAVFENKTFPAGATIRVVGSTANDTFTFGS